VKRHGVASTGEPVLFLSAEAHYSTPRAASVAGFGTDAAVTIATDAVGRMIPEKLERAIDKTRAEGKTPFMVVATSGTTVPGAFDPLDDIAEVTQRQGLWLHVDASFGGGVLFSPWHRHLMAGVERADSVTWNPHKMMGLPLTCSAILMREKGVLEATNGMHADYLFHESGGPTCDLGDLSLQCGRRVDAFKLWFSWIALGDHGYARRVERLFELAEVFRGMLGERDGFHLVREPEGTTVCFRYLPRSAQSLAGVLRRQREHELTVDIRRKLLESGRLMLNYAPLDGAATFRIVLSNPRTREADLEALLEAIEACGGR
jgi:glutamate/tyrosine decarboxylase-like PLP-dependent enzyme